MTKKQKLFIEHFKKSGNVSKTCEAIGIGRTTFYNWYKLREDFAQEIDNIKEAVIDSVEDKLFEKIQAGDITAIIFFLKTRAKHRGYTEKYEVTQQNKLQDVVVEIICDENNQS